MALTPEQQFKLLNKLGTIWKNKTCQLCGHDQWTITDTVFEMREFQGGQLVLGSGDRILPVLPVSCEKCGNTHIFNALTLGVIEQNKEGNKDE